MAFQIAAEVVGASNLQLLGTTGFGTAIGLFLASNARFGNRSGFQLGDLIGVVVVLLGGAALALFPASTDLFAAYGLGLFIGVAFYILYNIFFNSASRQLAELQQKTELLKSETEAQAHKFPEEKIKPLTPVQGDTLAINLSALRQILVESFNQTELETLCFDLGISFESLSGENKDKKIIELINYVKRRGKFAELIKLVQRERPNAPWFTLFS
jgi:hypothetical protein